MFNANTFSTYNFWYYQSLLEKPYTNLAEYYSTLIYERDKNNTIAVMEEGPELELECVRKHKSSKGVVKHNNYLRE